MSLLLARMVSFRRLAKWLTDFEGDSIVDLTSEHETLLQTFLAGELTRYNDILEDASFQHGGQLSFRESKQVCRKLGLFGPKSISNFVSTFNVAAWLLNEVDNLVVSIRLHNPREIDNINSNRMIGSADPNKVLTSNQIAKLECALARDLQRYKKARSLIDRELGDLDLDKIERKRPNPIFDLERYFGLNGFREHTVTEIAALRGLSSSSSMNVTQLIKRFLYKRLGAKLTAEVMKLRSQFYWLQLQKRFEEVRASRERILSILATVDLSFREPIAFCLERYFGLNGCRVHSLLGIEKQLGLKSSRSVFYYVREGLFSLVGEHKGKRILAVRGRLLYYLTRAIKAQVLRLQICVARRISAVLEIPAEPKLKIRMVEARRVVEIQFRAAKTWGMKD
jgi:hypothetical protein